VTEHAASEAAWLRLAEFEARHGDVPSLTHVHWRAARALPDAEGFDTAYVRLVARVAPAGGRIGSLAPPRT
jgi:hypothetical protein